MRVYVLWTPCGVAPDTLATLVKQALAKRLDGMALGHEGVVFRFPLPSKLLLATDRLLLSMPGAIDFEGAQCNVVIALYDDLMAARDDW